MGDATLLPCPLCGNTAVEPRRFDGEWSLVCADNRHMCEVTGMDRSDVIAAWNNRPAPALTPAQQAAEEMVRALREAKEFIENQQLPDAEWSRVLDVVVAALAKAGKP